MSIRMAVRSVLEDLMEKLRDEIIGCAVSTMNGLVISSAALPSVSSRLNSRRISKLGEIVSKMILGVKEEFRGMKIKSITIKGSKGYMISIAVNDILLLILTSEKPNLGLILNEIGSVSRRLKEMLER